MQWRTLMAGAAVATSLERLTNGNDWGDRAPALPLLVFGVWTLVQARRRSQLDAEANGLPSVPIGRSSASLRR